MNKQIRRPTQSSRRAWHVTFFVAIALLGFESVAGHVAGAEQKETVTIVATRDATLIEDPAGLLANGAGPALFAGRTGQATNGTRRAVVHFELEDALPRNALIERVFLTLHLTPSNEIPAKVAIHRLLDDWSEGPSFSSGGGGAPAEAGDATWLHAVYDHRFWVLAGGQFVAAASADAVVADVDFYTWQSTPQLVADVRLWLKAPDRNFGWIIVGDEMVRQSVKRFDSRESTTAEFRPALTVEYRLPGPPVGAD